MMMRRRSLVLIALFLAMAVLSFVLLSVNMESASTTPEAETLNHIQLQYAAYHLQKPMNTFSRIIGAVRLYQRLVATGRDLHADNPVKPDIQRTYIPEQFYFKAAIERGLFALDGADGDTDVVVRRLMRRERHGFQVVTVVDDLNHKAVIELVEGLLNREAVEMEEIAIFHTTNLSPFNHRYLQSRLHTIITALPPATHTDVNELGPLALLAATCRQCLYLHPEARLDGVGLFKSFQGNVFLRAPSTSDTILPVLQKFEPTIKATNPTIFKSVYINDAQQHRLAILTASALMRSKQCGVLASSAWWLGMVLTDGEFTVIGQPYLAGLPVGEELCGVLGATIKVEDGRTVHYTENVLKHTRYLNITHLQPITRYPSKACIPIDRQHCREHFVPVSVVE